MRTIVAMWWLSDNTAALYVTYSFRVVCFRLFEFLSPAFIVFCISCKQSQTQTHYWQLATAFTVTRYQ